MTYVKTTITDSLFDDMNNTNTDSYSYKMNELKKEVMQSSFVRKDSGFERRKEKFFTGPKNEAETNVINDIMFKIGFF